MKRTVNEWFVDSNFRYCVAFLKNGDERMRAIRLVHDVTGCGVKESARFVDELMDKLPLAAELDPPKLQCPMCRQPIEVERIKNKRCPVCGEAMPSADQSGKGGV